MRIPIPRMPIALKPNLILSFETQVPTGETNPRSGNPIMATTTTLVQAAVQIPRVGSKNVDTPGVNVTAVYCEGYIIGKLPEGLEFKAQNRIPATLKDGKGITQKGTFLIQNFTTSYSSELSKVAGIPIRGSFEAVGGG